MCVCIHTLIHTHKLKTRVFQTQLLHYFSKSDNKSNYHHICHGQLDRSVKGKQKIESASWKYRADLLFKECSALW